VQSENKEDGRKKPAAQHDFANLQRLATALENFNYPENSATTITVWCQGGGKGTAAQVTNEKTLDVAACHLIVDGHDDKKRLDLEKRVNFAIRLWSLRRADLGGGFLWWLV
jgi:hypothetical protein